MDNSQNLMTSNETQEPEAFSFHEYANLFPLIEGTALDDLRESIRANGVLNPIVLYDGQILDGRNRYNCAKALGIECPAVTYEGDDPLGYVVALNLERRHLTETQRAMVAGKIANIVLGHNQHEGRQICRSSEAPVSNATAAEMLNVSERSVRSARRVLDKGAEELQAAVEVGSVAVSTAADVATLPKEEQAQTVKFAVKEAA